MNDVEAEAEEVRPWQPDSGPRPRVTVYDRGREPALWVRVAGRWRYATVRARLEHADGRTAYRVNLQLPVGDGEEGGCSRAYWWGPGVRAAHGPGDRRRPAHIRALDAA